MRNSFGVIAIALVMVGCASNGKVVLDRKPDKSPGESEATAQTVLTEGGTLTFRDPKGNRGRLWTVQWKEGSFSLEQNDLADGRIQHVTGSLFREDLGASTFRSNSAAAEQKGQVLRLIGNVLVKSLSKGATLRCDEVVWDTRTQILQAKGNIRLETDSYDAGPFPEIWTNADLTHIATPDMYKEQLHAL